MVCTARPLPVDRSMTAAQGPQGQTNLTDVLAAHSGAPGRPRTPDSTQAHRHQGKKIGVTGDARIIHPFSRPRRERDSAQRTRSSSAATFGLAACGLPLMVRSGTESQLYLSAEQPSAGGPKCAFSWGAVRQTIDRSITTASASGGCVSAPAT